MFVATAITPARSMTIWVPRIGDVGEHHPAKAGNANPEGSGSRLMRTSVLFAVLLPLFTAPAFGGEPEINVKAVCKARSADAKSLQVPPDQSEDDCARDEEAAKQQLGILWKSTSVFIRNRCQSDARSLGTMSYLDLLTCIQIAEDLKSGPQEETRKQSVAQRR
jgi:hypothetical protein